MSQITWKNIAAPNLRGAMYGMDKAADRVQGAFDPLDRLLQEKKARDAQNFDNSVENNNRAIAAKLQGVGSLNELDQAKEAGLNLQNLNDRLGSMYDPDALESGLNKRQDTLTQEAYGVARTDALKAADEKSSVTAGIPVMEQRLRSAGVAAKDIPTLTAQYMNESAPQEAQYEETRKQNTVDLLSRVGTPKNSKEAQSFLDQADKEGIPYNRDQFMKTLTKELTGHRNDIATERATREFGWELEDRAEQKKYEATFDKAYANAGTALKNGNIGQAFTAIDNADMPASMKIKASSQISDRLVQTRQIMPEQKLAIDQQTKNAISTLENFKESGKQEINQLEKQYYDAAGFTPQVQEYVTELVTKGSTAADALAQEVPHDLLHSSLIGKKQGDDAKEVINQKISFLRGKGVNEVDANTIVYQAAKEAIQDSAMPTGGKGVDTDTLDTAVQKRLDQYTAAQDIKNDWTTLESRFATDVKQIESGIENYNTNALRRTMDGNIKGKQTELTPFSLDLTSTGLGKYYQKQKNEKTKTAVKQLKSQADKLGISYTKDTTVKALQSKIQKALQEVGNTEDTQSKTKEQEKKLRAGEYNPNRIMTEEDWQKAGDALKNWDKTRVSRW